jgi:hypothetical protein
VALPDLDLSGLTLPRLAVVATVAYRDADGVDRVARWMGPSRKHGSALVVVGLEDSTPTPRQYVARLRSVVDDLDLGGLTNAVQTASEMTLEVDLGHLDDEAGLMRDAQLGYWSAREARVWVVQLEAAGGSMHATRAREIFAGRVVDSGLDRLRLGEGASLRLKLRDTLLPEDERIPTTYMWSDDELKNGLAPYTETGAGASGDYVWHPAASSGAVADAYNNGPFGGRHVGVVYGRHDSVATRFTSGTPAVLRPLAFYGAQQAAVGATHYFFHVSPQFDCFVLNDSVKAVWFVQTSTGTLTSLETLYGASLPNVNIRCFNNRDPKNGPVGTNVRLLINNGDSPDGSGGLGGGGFAGVDGAQCWAICYGPGGGVLDTSAPDTTAGLALGGTVEALTQAGLAAIRNRDHEVFRDLVELAGFGSILDGAGLAEYDSNAPAGPAGTGLYREIGCAVPLEPTDDPPKLREVLGELAMVGCGDVIVRHVGGARRLTPIRRRPNSAQGAADYKVRLADFYDGRDVYSARPEVEHDPRNDGATVVEVRAPDRNVPGVALGSTSTTASIATSIDGPRRRYEDAAHEAAVGARIVRRVTLEHWLPQEPPAWVSGDEDPAFSDAAKMLSGNLTQPQRYITATLGWRALLWELGDTVQYEGIPGLHLADVGQIRKIRRDYLRMSATITSVHLPDGFSVPVGDTEDEG